MKKIMISQPMAGKTKEEIDKERNEMAEQLLRYFGDDCEIMATTVENYEEKSDLECFSESIFFMSKCDVLCMGDGWANARGCKLEHEIAKAYNVPIIYLDNGRV